ncbi:ABC transporter ATP-binding protein [Nitrosomonas eutropha]|uniref:Phospholipid/cholesterol/gamma-HCH transport system ATP-binding protein n=2 Tax=Nitrosomonas eutropha TaxID=916 RepID=A0ABX5M7A6_9PROT|nr:ATP-binding cassette domain-containing protein [Nitrosomonas eutropha]ABI60453.1 ABC transporter-related protein [Nitrosomonas eutropha C91]PXV77779.1 phospholipid/cholesterol/gamma-HCH transport system ATP-binding protein [Nitrosomonas eutropha]SEJ17351.1 phospholipid/cholesterol/gamma-HCH transport system ATP-binding protein [Nitrosomonas eutropha]
MTTAEPVIEIAGLTTRFGQNVIHENINLTVLKGEVLALVGGSGSGKTTLLRQMLGLITPAQGSVKVFGATHYDCGHEKERELRTRSGVLFQQGALFSALTVFDNIALPMRELRILSETMVRDLVMLKLGMVGVEAQHVHKMPSELSGGMIKRVALARALALDPELLFLDEPTAGLDPALSESFVELIRSLREELALTIVMVTHDLDTLVAISDRVVVLANRSIVALGPIPDIIANGRHPFIKDFFGGARGRNALRIFQQL